MSTDDKVDIGGLCRPCRKFLIGWVDEVSRLDRQLDLIGALCLSSDGADLDPKAVGAIGAYLRDYREQRTIVSFAFLGRELVTLGTVGLDEADPAIQGEMLRLSARRPRRLC